MCRYLRQFRSQGTDLPGVGSSHASSTSGSSRLGLRRLADKLQSAYLLLPRINHPMQAHATAWGTFQSQSWPEDSSRFPGEALSLRGRFGRKVVLSVLLHRSWRDG